MQSLIAFPLPIEEYMQLRKEHEQLIRAEIERQMSEVVDSFRPHGWTKLTHFLREWGLVATAVVVPFTLLGILITVVIFATNGITKEAQFRTHTEDRLTNIEGTLLKINATLDGAKLKQIGANPENPENITEVKNVLIAAASNKVRIDRSIVKDVGAKFVEASQKDPAAWGAVLAFLNYKSFLDSSALNIPSGKVEDFVTRYNYTTPAGDAAPHFSVTGMVPINEAAKFDLIGRNQNQNQAKGNAFIMVDRGGQVIDGYQLKNVVFRNVHIVYKGGPLVLENVYFVNCQFDVDRQANGEQFAGVLIHSEAAATFTAA
jgi:hypothetical protein